MTLSYEQTKRLDDLISRVDRLEPAEFSELRALHGAKRAAEPPVARVLPHAITEATDLADDVLIVSVDADEPLGQFVHTKTDLRLAVSQGKTTWATPQEASEYVTAHEETLQTFWERRQSSKGKEIDAAFRAVHTYFGIVTDDDRWDARRVMATAGVRIFDERRGNLVCGWWLLSVPDPRLLFRWFLTEEQRQAANESWSPWQTADEETRSAARTPLAKLLLDTARLRANRSGESLGADIETFWKRALATKHDTTIVPARRPLAARKVASR